MSFSPYSGYLAYRKNEVDAMPDTHPLRLEVGTYFDSGIKRWPGTELILTTQGCVLIVDRVSPTPEQIDQFKTADLHFAWIDGRHNGFLCFRFGSGSWDFIAHNPHRDTPAGMIAGLPGVAPGERLAVGVGLEHSDRTPVLAARVIAWPEYFVSAVRETIARLAIAPFDSDRANDESNALFIYVGRERLVQRASVRATALTATGEACVGRPRVGWPPD